MNRQTLALAALGSVLVAVLFFFFLYSPKSDELAELELQIESTLAQQDQLRNRIRTLEEVRTRAPEIEAAIGTAEAIIPRDPGLPAALRQLSLAADGAGVVLPTISIGRPAVGPGPAQTMSVAVTIGGSYFQIIDFLRRIEDPTITARGLIFSSVSIGPDEYPTLSASLSGTMFTQLSAPVAPAPPAEEPADDATEEDGA